MAKGPISSVGSVIGWIAVAGLVIAVMTLWNWDPIAFITYSLDRLSNLFLSWDWFRNIVGGA